MRKTDKKRWMELVGAATEVFLSKGYKRTQMADITEAMGLSAGAIYRYVESKQALFDLVVRAGAGVELETSELVPPIATPRPGATLAFLQRTLKREGRIASLDIALARTKAEDAGGEFESIVGELYRKTSQFRVGIKLLDCSALDWPELAALWCGHWRAGLVNQLSRYLDLRISQRLLLPVPDTKAWARFIVETVVFFALHRHYDPFPTAMSETVAEDTVVRALSRATSGGRKGNSHAKNSRNSGVWSGRAMHAV
jgi:AcrR family transcriptional regulator